MEIIIEVGNSHEGSLGIATSMVGMIKSVGGKIAKFQYHIAEEESSLDEPFRIRFSSQDSNRTDYWRRVTFTENEWKILANHCREQQIEFLCTPFSVKAAKFLAEQDLVQRFKIGSGDALHFPLIDYVISTNLPIIVSTGLVNEDQIEILVRRLEKANYLEKTTLMHCVSEYPTKLNRVALGQIENLKKYGCKVGFSDHSGNLSAALFASALGIELLEFHITPNKLFFGPDTSSSLDLPSAELLIKTLVDFETLRDINISKNELFESSRTTAEIFGRSIYWAESLPSGSKIRLSNLAFLKPASSGIPAMNYEELIGKVTTCNVHKGAQIAHEDFR